MVIIDHRRPLGWTLRQAYFPVAEELQAIVAAVPATTVLRVRQTCVAVPDHRWLVQRSPCPTAVLDLTRGSDRLLAGMKRMTRRQLQLAEAEKDRITITRNDSATLETYLRLHNDFVRASGYTTPLSSQELSEYAAVADVFVLTIDGEPTVGHLLVVDRMRRRTVIQYSVSRRHEAVDGGRLASLCNRYLHWFELQLYAAQGMELYDFGGIRDAEHPASLFKLSFGCSRVDEHFYVFARPAARAALRLHRAPVVQALHRFVGA